MQANLNGESTNSQVIEDEDVVVVVEPAKVVKEEISLEPLTSASAPKLTPRATDKTSILKEIRPVKLAAPQVKSNRERKPM